MPANTAKARSPAVVRLLGLAKIVALLASDLAVMSISGAFIGFWSAVFSIYFIWKWTIEIGTGQPYAETSQKSRIGAFLIWAALALTLVVVFFAWIGREPGPQGAGEAAAVPAPAAGRSEPPK